jgi:Spy/CpxP family protein refolding chaperone
VAQLRSEEIDQELVKARIAEHRAKMDHIIDLLVVRLAEFHKTLTPEQKEKLVAKLETFKKWHGKRWE